MSRRKWAWALLVLLLVLAVGYVGWVVYAVHQVQVAPGPGVKRQAAWLGRLAGPIARPLLKCALHSPDHARAGGACAALCTMGDQHAVLEWLKSADPAVAGPVTVRLLDVDPASARPVLSVLLGPPQTRPAALTALQQEAASSGSPRNARAVEVLSGETQPARTAATKLEASEEWEAANAKWREVLALLPDDQAAKAAIAANEKRIQDSGIDDYGGTWTGHTPGLLHLTTVQIAPSGFPRKGHVDLQVGSGQIFVLNVVWRTKGKRLVGMWGDAANIKLAEVTLKDNELTGVVYPPMKIEGDRLIFQQENWTPPPPMDFSGFRRSG